jgi:hypothetical protein
VALGQRHGHGRAPGACAEHAYLADCARLFVLCMGWEGAAKCPRLRNS